MTTHTPSYAPSGGNAGWSRALVYGLGVSGRAAARLLLSRGVAVVGVDRRAASELAIEDLASFPGFTLAEGEPAELPERLDGVVLSPGVPPDLPLLVAARECALPVIAEVELAFPLLDGPVVAITGSNGKSTTTALAGEMLRAAGREVEVCGNIGTALSACVEGAARRAFVVELSSFQLEAIDRFRPDAAALLNLAPDHLDRYADLDAYGEAKAAIFSNQGPDEVAVLNADDPWVAAVATRARRRTFSRLRAVEDGCYLQDATILEAIPGQPPRELFRTADLRLSGIHNLENAMAAALLAVTLGAEPGALRSAAGSFAGLPHRTELVGESGGVSWYDDSKGTNPAATKKSLEGFADGSVHLILGGRNKGADPEDLASVVGKKAVRLYLIGEAAGELENALGALVPSERSETLEAAVEAAARNAEAPQSVLLSPACASFDQYESFAHRGRHFQQLAREHIAATGGGDG